jgi:hypothetical protein
MKEKKGEQRCGSDDGLSNASPWSWPKGAGIGSTPNLAPVFHLTAMAMRKGD